MMRWFHALMPKEERFFELFARHSDAVLAGSHALRAMMEGGAAIASNCEAVVANEHKADDVTREVLIAVRRTFITPFDRVSRIEFACNSRPPPSAAESAGPRARNGRRPSPAS